MPDISPEVLVVADSGDGLGAVMAALQAVATVTAVMPPRLALVRPQPASVLPAVTGVRYGRSGLAVVPDDATAEELLFVEAWRLRFAPKARPGDGSAWDDPPDSGDAERHPPDRPRPSR